MEQIRFDATTVPPEDAFDHWRVGVGDFHLTIRDATAPFDGISTITSLAGIIVSESDLPALRWERTAAMALADGHDMWSLSLVLSGGMSGDADGNAFSVGPGGMVLFTHTRPTFIETAPGRTIVLAIPGDMLGSVDPALAHGALPAGPETQLLADTMLALAQVLPTLGAPAALPTRQALLALVGVAARTMAPQEPVARRDRSLRAEAIAFIQANPQAAANSAVLCDALAVSRSALYRALARDGGLRPLARRLRLQEAHRMLADPADTRTIQQIAHSVGYFDSSLFSRHFASDFGYTAATFRARPEVPPLIEPGSENIPADFLNATQSMDRRPAPG